MEREIYHQNHRIGCLIFFLRLYVCIYLFRERERAGGNGSGELRELREGEKNKQIPHSAGLEPHDPEIMTLKSRVRRLAN